MFFAPSRAILRDEYLTSAVRTKEGDEAGSNHPPARDPVQFKLELTPNYLISYLGNTGSRSTRYVSMPHPNESSILPKFLEKSDPEVARPAFSTWPVQNLSQRHLRYARRFKSTNQRIATVGSSNKHPCAGQGCGFLPSLLARRGPRVSLAPKTTQTPATQAKSWRTPPEKSHWILQSWSYYVKIYFTRHQHDTKRTQNRAGL